MAVDNKYGRVRFDEDNTIGEDEPVVVFRAADPRLAEVLDYYGEVCKLYSSPQVHLDLIGNTRQKIVDWQQKNPDKVRPVPSSSNWDGEHRV
jgi:hypothetical protein